MKTVCVPRVKKYCMRVAPVTALTERIINYYGINYSINYELMTCRRSNHGNTKPNVASQIRSPPLHSLLQRQEKGKYNIFKS